MSLVFTVARVIMEVPINAREAMNYCSFMSGVWENAFRSCAVLNLNSAS
jgi:hypothetical protein